MNQLYRLGQLVSPSVSKAYDKVWLMNPLTKDEFDKRDGRQSDREIYNRLIHWIQTQFSAEISLKFRHATIGTKLLYSTDDTDVVYALKTILNLISKKYLADPLDTLDIVSQVLALRRCQSLLKSLLLERDWQDSLVLFNSAWNDFKEFLNPEEDESKNNSENLSEKIYQQYQSLIQKLKADDKEKVSKVKKIFSIPREFLNSESTIDRAVSLLKTIWDKSDLLEEFIDFICEVFHYLDYLEARAGAPGLYSDVLTKKILDFINKKEDLKKKMDLKGRQLFVDKRLRLASKRQATIETTLADETPPKIFIEFQQICQQIHEGKSSVDSLAFLQNKDNQTIIKNYLESIQYSFDGLGGAEGFIQCTLDFIQGNLPTQTLGWYKSHLSDFTAHFFYHDSYLRGLKATKDNLSNLQRRLSTYEKTRVFVNLSKAIDLAYDNTKKLEAKLPSIPAFKLLQDKLKNLKELMQSFTNKDFDQQHQLVKGYYGLQTIYRQLTDKIPLTCHHYLQKFMSDIDHRMHQIQKNFPEIENAYQQVRESRKAAHQGTIIAGLTAINASANQLTLAIDKKKEDFLDNLTSLSKNIEDFKQIVDKDDDFDSSQGIDVIQKIARNIVDLRRSAAEGRLDKHPELAKKWQDLGEKIDYLRERDSLFARAIESNTPPLVSLENAEYRQKLGLSSDLTQSLTSVEQLLKIGHKAIRSAHAKLAEIINNQPKDSLYYQTLYQEEWQLFSFDDQETTETYLLKLFSNILFQLHEATTAGIAPHIRLSKLPLDEINALIDELPAFVINSGIKDSVLEAVSAVKMLISAVGGADAGKFAKFMTDINKGTANPLGSIAYSGLVSKDIPKLFNFIGSIARINHELDQKDPKISGEVKAIILAPDESNLVNGDALKETQQLLLKVMVELDNAATTNPLAEHKITATIKKVSETVYKKLIHPSDQSKTQSLLKEFKFVEKHPFLLERTIAQQENLRKTQQKMADMHQKLPAPVRQFIAIMKRGSANVVETAIIEKNRPLISQFLKDYSQEKNNNLKSLEDMAASYHANKKEKFQKNGASPLQMAKIEKDYQEKRTEFQKRLHSLYENKIDNTTALFELPETDWNSLAQELTDYVASHDRAIRSVEHSVKSLENALAAKKDLLRQKITDDYEALYRQLHSGEKKGFTEAFIHFARHYHLIQSNGYDFMDFRTRHDIKFLCQAVGALANISREASQWAQTIVDAEIQFSAIRLSKVLEPVGTQAAAELLKLLDPLATATGVAAVDLDKNAFAEKAAVFLREQPGLRKSLQEFSMMFYGLETAVNAELRKLELESEKLTYHPGLFHQMQAIKNAPDLETALQICRSKSYTGD